MKFKRFSPHFIAAFLGIIIAVQIKSIFLINSFNNEEKSRIDRLKETVTNEKSLNEDLKRQIALIELQKKQFQKDAESKSTASEGLKNELETTNLLAGLTDVKGSGIQLTFFDSESADKIEDRDVLNIVNTLNKYGANAVSVNNERIVINSEIRKAGSYIVINGNQVLSPYIIKAIGQVDKLKGELDKIGGILDTLKTIYHINYKVELKEDMIIGKADKSLIKTDYLEIIK